MAGANARPARGAAAKIERTFRTKQDVDDWLVSQRSSVILQGTFVDPRQAERSVADVITAWKEG